MNESRIADIENSIAFQEKSIEELSGVIHRQQQEIDRLSSQCKKLAERLDQQEGPEMDAGEATPEVPPHY